MSAALSLQWCHNECDGVSNHRRLHCLFNCWFRRRSKKYRSSASLAFVRGIQRWPMNSLHKWPVTRKMFPFDNVIVCRLYCVKEMWHWGIYNLRNNPNILPEKLSVGYALPPRSLVINITDMNCSPAVLGIAKQIGRQPPLWPVCYGSAAVTNNVLHDDVMIWKRFPHHWPFVRGIHQSPVDSEGWHHFKSLP